jgi:hypothetical protein
MTNTTETHKPLEGPLHPDEPSHRGGNDPDCIYCERANR